MSGIFGGALVVAESWRLSKVKASMPFTVTIGVFFISGYVGGRFQDAKGPRIVALIYAIPCASTMESRLCVGGTDFVQ